MTVLVWDQAGERRYETGVDRGVLYLNGTTVPWNGIVSVAEDLSRETKPFYHEGMKYLDAVVMDAYSAKLQAFTYPDLLDYLTGVQDAATGIAVHDQQPRVFHLSYRTKVGTDLDPDAGHKIHVVYNVLAVPSDHTFQTTDDNPDLEPFEWSLTTRAQIVSSGGFRPASHVSIDTREIDSARLAIIEERLYGSVSAAPNLPSINELLTL